MRILLDREFLYSYFFNPLSFRRRGMLKLERYVFYLSVCSTMLLFIFMGKLYVHYVSWPFLASLLLIIIWISRSIICNWNRVAQVNIGDKAITLITTSLKSADIPYRSILRVVSEEEDGCEKIQIHLASEMDVFSRGISTIVLTNDYDEFEKLKQTIVHRTINSNPDFIREPDGRNISQTGEPQ